MFKELSNKIVTQIFQFGIIPSIRSSFDHMPFPVDIASN